MFYQQTSFVPLTSSFRVVFSLLILLAIVATHQLVSGAPTTVSCSAGALPALTGSPYNEGLIINLAGGCSATVSAIQTSSITISGSIDTSTSLTLDKVAFVDAGTTGVTTSLIKTGVIVDASNSGVDQLVIRSCSINRILANVDATSLTFITVSFALRAKTVRITGNTMNIVGIKSSGLHIFIFFNSLGILRVSNEFTMSDNILENKNAGASPPQSPVTPVFTLARFGGDFICTAPVITFFQNAVNGRMNTDGAAFGVLSIASPSIVTQSKLLISSNRITVYPQVVNSGKIVSATLVSFANANVPVSSFDEIEISDNDLNVAVILTGAGSSVDAVLFSAGSDYGIKDIAKFNMTANQILLTNTQGSSGIITRANLIDVKAVIESNLQLHGNVISSVATVLAMSFDAYKLGTVQGTTNTIINITTTTVTSEGQVSSALAVFRQTIVRIDAFATKIKHFGVKGCYWYCDLPLQFLSAKLEFVVFPLYSYQLHFTEIIGNSMQYTSNSAKSVELFMYRDAFAYGEEDLNAANWYWLQYKPEDITTAVQQKFIFPKSPSAIVKNAVTGVWRFELAQFTGSSLDMILADDSKSFTDVTTADITKFPIVLPIVMFGSKSFSLKLRVAFSVSNPIVYTPSKEAANSIQYFGSQGPAELCLAESKQVSTTTSTSTTTTAQTTTTTSTTTTSTTTGATTTTTATTTSTTTETTPAPPTTTTTTTPAPPTTTTETTLAPPTTTTTTRKPRTRTRTYVPPTPAPTSVPLTKAAGDSLAAASAALAAVPIVAMGVSRMAAVSALLDDGDCTGPGPGEEMGFVDNAFGVVIWEAGEDGRYLAGSVVGNVYVGFAILVGQTFLGYLWCRFRDGVFPYGIDGFVEVAGRCHVTVFVMMMIGLWMTPTITNALTYAIRSNSKLGWSAFLVFSMLVSQIACCYWVYYCVYGRQEVEQFVVMRDDEGSDDENDFDEQEQGAPLLSSAQRKLLGLDYLEEDKKVEEEQEEDEETSEEQKRLKQLKKKINSKKKMKSKKMHAKSEPLGNSPKHLAIRFYRYWIRPVGDWYIPGDVDEADYHSFESAAPVVDAHTKKGRFFTIPDVALQVGLAFAPIAAELVGEGRKSCLALGLCLTICLGIYFVLLVWYTPMRSRLIEYVLAFVTLIQLVVCIIATITYATSPVWLDDAQLVLTIAGIVQAIAGMMDWANRFLVPFIQRLYHKQWHKRRYALSFEDFLKSLNAQEAEELGDLKALENEEEALEAKIEQRKIDKKLELEEQQSKRLKALKEEEEERARQALLFAQEMEKTPPQVIRQEETVTFDASPVVQRGPTDEEVLAWRRHELKQLKWAMNDLF